MTTFIVSILHIDATNGFLMQCIGCNPSSESQYYCPQQSQMFYIQCESGLAEDFTIDVYPVFNTPIVLSRLTEENNVIVKEGVSVVVGRIDLHSDGIRARFVTLILLNLTSVDMEFIVSCDDGMTSSTKTFSPLKGI